MVGRLGEDLRLLDGVDEDLPLRGAAPVGLGVPPEDVDREHAEEADGDEGVDPVHGEHERDAHQRREQGHPLVVPIDTSSNKRLFKQLSIKYSNVLPGIQVFKLDSLGLHLVK